MSADDLRDDIKADNLLARFARKRGNCWFFPAVCSGLLHGAAILMLWGGGWPEPQANAPASRVQTQLMTLIYEAAEPLTAVEPPPMESLPVKPPPIIEPEPVVDQAAIARKRVEEQERKEEQRREKIRQEQLAESKRLEEQQRQHEQELARQQAQAEQEAERVAREARARADAEAEAGRREAEFIAQYQPVNKTPPAYPRRALDSRIEGDCTVSYTVTPDGRVNKPEVLEEACDDAIFIRPSLQAASAFRYQPRIVNGRAVAVHDVRNTFRYRIQ